MDAKAKYGKQKAKYAAIDEMNRYPEGKIEG